MNKLEFIRDEEKMYHDFCYDNYKLFEEGSWLYKPVKTVMDLLPSLGNIEKPSVLDLGSGVGRNSIPIAEKIKGSGGKVVCVDLLDSAIEKLNTYSKEFGVGDVIRTIKADIGNYPIPKNTYDLIVAVSSLEHVATEADFEKILHRMAEGTNPQGINCIIVNSEVEEIDLKTNQKLDALMEINMPTKQMITKLQTIYKGWEVIKHIVKPLEYEITRNEKPILLKTNAITYVVRKEAN
ncbi:SAM-dependent methyltransferase [Evansella vedderi]|uniref:SAM-dependent methyltransferase n=1 Tax=Evansella vedderi TaxID=38282 RepID=A0ABT9ZNE6_9BACI|nr:class I SAM-dependent methyltransferase [Evansella vedderi]MDQ0252764.1 SAM-dependent methyltransferase [Evansella vedderi]